MTTEKVGLALAALDATDDIDRFVSEWLFERPPVVLASEAAYRDWRHSLADALDVDPRGIVVVGSGAFGNSMREDKQFRPFSENSDVDVAIVSHRYFEEAWFYLRRVNARRYGLPSEVQEDFEKWARRRVFNGIIIANVLLPHLPFGAGWQRALGDKAISEPVAGRTINVQIYRDLEALREYQVDSLSKTKRSRVNLNAV